MKIGILTFHKAHNFGAVLQAYALQEYLKSLGHDVQIVDYKPHYITRVYRIIDFKRIRRPSVYLFLRAVVKECLLFPVRVLKVLKYNRFSKKYFSLASFNYPYATIPVFDAYVIGSDQLWNLSLTANKMDKFYWGEFKRDCQNLKLITYAVSAGNISLLYDKQESVKNNLAAFSALSVREKDFGDWLTSLGVSNTLVIDPTLLFNADFYRRIMVCPKTKEKYLLLYQIVADDTVREVARDIAKTLNLKLIELAAFPTRLPNNISAASPQEFLGYISNAEFVLTSSFHGTVFSVLFKKNFYSCMCGDSRDSRSRTLLSNLQLEDRMLNIKNYSKEQFQFQIDYTSTQEDKLIQLRENSYNFLTQALNG